MGSQAWFQTSFLVQKYVLMLPAPHSPSLVSTWSFGLRGHRRAWDDLAAGGTSLDAIEAACGAIEADEEIDSVGYGGLPDAEGVMTLDGCVMTSASNCGSVCCIRRHLHPVRIARAVMERTSHVMLVGEGADAFADELGEPTVELLSPAARAAWEQWKRDGTIPDQIGDGVRPVDQEGSGRLFSAGEDDWKHHDTIGTLALDAQGRLAGGCSTSGAPFKLPGRVGDSPIIGHGLYVDPEVAGVAATGSGELVMGCCGSFLAVEAMRRGVQPVAALLEVLERIQSAHALDAGHQVCLVALTAGGGCFSVALRPGFKVSVSCNGVHEAREPDAILLES